jgi:hypothetical protein
MTFACIEKAADLEHMRPFYKMASNSTHASPKGVGYRLGLMPDSPLLLAGPSDYGLADPGQNSAISLMQLTVCLLTTNPTIDGLMTLTAMQRLVDEIREAFCKIQFEIEKEQEESGGMLTPDRAQ